MTPHLPKQWTVGCGELNGQKVCRVEDVIAYGAACAAAATEAAAQICDEFQRRHEQLDNYGKCLAAAIRARSKP
jgi:hypothetical protein